MINTPLKFLSVKLPEHLHIWGGAKVLIFFGKSQLHFTLLGRPLSTYTDMDFILLQSLEEALEHFPPLRVLLWFVYFIEVAHNKLVIALCTYLLTL